MRSFVVCCVRKIALWSRWLLCIGIAHMFHACLLSVYASLLITFILSGDDRSDITVRLWFTLEVSRNKLWIMHQLVLPDLLVGIWWVKTNAGAESKSVVRMVCDLPLDLIYLGKPTGKEKKSRNMCGEDKKFPGLLMFIGSLVPTYMLLFWF